MRRGTILRATGTASVLALAALLASRGGERDGSTPMEPTAVAARTVAAPAVGPPPASLRDFTPDDDPSIRGIVVDGTGAPVAGAEVAASREGNPRPNRAETGADGRFVLVGVETGADWLLGARAEGLAPEVRGGVRAGDEVRLVLRRPIRLS